MCFTAGHPSASVRGLHKSTNVERTNLWSNRSCSCGKLCSTISKCTRSCMTSNLTPKTSTKPLCSRWKKKVYFVWCGHTFLVSRVHGSIKKNSILSTRAPLQDARTDLSASTTMFSPGCPKSAKKSQSVLAETECSAFVQSLVLRLVWPLFFFLARKVPGKTNTFSCSLSRPTARLDEAKHTEHESIDASCQN